MKACYHSNLILTDRVLEDAFIVVEDGIITYIGNKKPQADKYTVCEGYIAPGFVDIHCHDCPVASGYDAPKTVADYHYNCGTTSMLISVYRGETHERYTEIIKKIKDAMPETKNLCGIHFEGPYLNGKYGAQAKEQDYPIRENYLEYLKSGIIRQWTCSPEVEGSIELIAEIKNHGIVPAIGHSEASYKQVEKAVSAGAKITTHIYDATGTTPDGKAYMGTHDVSFSEACMLFDMYYEVICDSAWIHLKKEMLRLIKKTVGIDRIVAITDCCFCPGYDADSDINIKDGEIMGSKLTMDTVAKNLFNAGYTMPDIAKMTARNPACAINLNKCGELHEGYKADLILVDSNYKFIRHLY